MKTIAIIGSGPAGCTLAILLKRKGLKVGLFSDTARTELFVGESMIPAIIPILRELGIEEGVKKFSIYKPGATVWVKNNLHAEAPFDKGLGKLPGYAYNTNRKQLDQLLLDTARKEGVQLFEYGASVEVHNGTVRFDKETLSLCTDFFNGQPDFFVDATGRKRLLSNLLKLPTTKGNRMDTALFAHVEGVDFSENYGDIHMHLATKGWCWRIPLHERTSVGIVVNAEELKKYGSTLEEQYDNYLAQEANILGFFKNVKRITPIQKYSNYQLKSDKIYGENWALVGDAAGFLDPVFSSGLYFSMHYAKELAEAIDPKNQMTFSQFEQNWHQEIEAWRGMIELWYNGRLFTNFLMGNDRLNTRIGKAIGNHAVKHFTSIFTGEAVRNRYSMWLLKFMTGPLLDRMYKFRMHKYKIKDLEL